MAMKNKKKQLTIYLRKEQYEDLNFIQKEKYPDLSIQDLICMCISNAAREHCFPFNEEK